MFLHALKLNVITLKGKRKILWSISQSSWSGFDSRRHHIFWEAVGLEQGPLSLVSTTEEPLDRKSGGSSLESREFGVGIRYAENVYLSISKSWH
jgi:hypothetical protein